jgi:hypothetical protein
VVQAVAQQKDYMKRLRKNGGARDILAREGIAILSGTFDADLIQQLGFNSISKDEFISCTPDNDERAALLRTRNHIV